MDKETRDEFTKIKIQEGIAAGVSARVRTVCITSTSALFGFFMWLGSTVYDKFPAFKAAVIAFISADKGLK